ncbi:MAG: cupredoxin domain-containing protein [Chloroflexi bacterium]|nr:cupredoxin domain-containing protein [Chloroflexota bacterium]
MFQKVLVLGIGLSLLFLMASCTTAAEASTVRVTANEWSLAPDRSSVRAGQVTLEAMNQGRAGHEVVVLKTDLAADALKLKANGAEVDESASGEVVGEVEDIGSGQTKSVTLNLAPGRYVLTCNILGHYHAGMVTVLEVS